MALLRFHVTAEGGIDTALVSMTLCFEEIHHVRVRQWDHPFLRAPLPSFLFKV